ncbi:DNA-binding response regulator [Bifidobacterium rousetti]|uniref:response regulator transcription factor n=1 Tax=Bifidobacterium rousetti TaxID=2045439 RepID=UPI0012395B9B|nr:response regulator transcription factor [Bifidobacterium rousetti]KAA8820425.1 DNA-binding response regulator [Bifidobacterium rousetti]
MSENSRIRVVVADDQELVRAGFAMVIGSQPDMDVVGQAGDGDQAVELAGRLRPDVMLMDVRMPGMDGIEATRRITSLDAATATGPDAAGAEPANGSRTPHPTRVIILTTFDLDEYVMAAIEAGASGFLLKDTEPETLLASIRTVFQGNAIIAPSATRRLIENMVRDGYASAGSPTWNPAVGVASHDASGAVTNRADHIIGHTGRIGHAGHVGERPAPANAPLDTDRASALSEAQGFYTDPELDLLTDREREVLVEIAHGLSNQEIADKLFVSLPTVKTHVAHILSKIHARDRVQAVVFAYDNRLV